MVTATIVASIGLYGWEAAVVLLCNIKKWCKQDSSLQSILHFSYILRNRRPPNMISQFSYRWKCP